MKGKCKKKYTYWFSKRELWSILSGLSRKEIIRYGLRNDLDFNDIQMSSTIQPKRGEKTCPNLTS